MLANRTPRRTLVAALLFLLVAILPAAAQDLRFVPDPNIPVDQQFVVPLVLDSGGFLVKGVEVDVTFDPSLVSLDSITPGPWYTDSGQDFFFWDYTTPGTDAFHFASALLDGTQAAEAVIAYGHFSVVSYGLCPLDFTLVKVRDGENVPVAVAADPGLIVLDPAISTEGTNLGSLKARFR